MSLIIELKNHYYNQRTEFPESFRLRIHRALSWFEQAEMMAKDSTISLKHNLPNHNIHSGTLQKEWDFIFISLWISFNAAYARDLESNISTSERSNLRIFLQTVCQLDKEKRIYRLVWETFSDSILNLLNNRYVFQPFWDFHNGKISEQAWLEAFGHSRSKAQQALVQQDTEALLAVVFDRLYTLRNQMVHGGATYQSSANREQVRNGCAFLSACIRLILQIMMQNPTHEAWGKPFYPFIKEH
ncbi:MAG: HEPN domain-containing protein [Neisseria zoodegmatis]|uniref:HEPN domain-containing protein n=1 Tax=Neisseria zoodegmatis TaxID=326523 RepID=UPI0026F08BAC|nr:HEPN domain-containing protein [Neisseria zoodegmatis]MDO5070254.1 HEPN domain-containing protein [Neisseria zoodegmatis]